MELEKQLQSDMADSMRAGTSFKTGVLRLLRGSLKNEAIKLGHDLTGAEALKVIQREAKQRRDSIEQYRAAGRDDLVKVEADELEVVTGYLPQAMTAEELKAVVAEVVAETGASSAGQMGQVIGLVMKRVGARAEGGAVSAAVRAHLAG